MVIWYVCVTVLPPDTELLSRLIVTCAAPVATELAVLALMMRVGKHLKLHPAQHLEGLLGVPLGHLAQVHQHTDRRDSPLGGLAQPEGCGGIQTRRGVMLADRAA